MNNSMQLCITEFAIDNMMANVPAEQRYDWLSVSEQVEAAGFNKGSWLWWMARNRDG